MVSVSNYISISFKVLNGNHAADAGDVSTEVVPLADKSCTLSIIQRVVEYLKKHAEFESTGADDETINAYDKNFQEQSDEIIFQTILAANFLDIKNLLELMVYNTFFSNQLKLNFSSNPQIRADENLSTRKILCCLSLTKFNIHYIIFLLSCITLIMIHDIVFFTISDFSFVEL